MSRTFGETRDCQGCRYWSEMLARAGGGTDNPRGDVEAYCLNADGPESGNYKVATDTCGGWASGHHGAVDDPPDYGVHARAAYAADDLDPSGVARPPAFCVGCNKYPDAIEEYVEAFAENGYATPDEYVWNEEGTLNRANGHFLCTDCYIAAGIPSSEEGWKAP